MLRAIFDKIKKGLAKTRSLFGSVASRPNAATTRCTAASMAF